MPTATKLHIQNDHMGSVLELKTMNGNPFYRPGIYLLLSAGSLFLLLHFFSFSHPFSEIPQEICDNGVDDDFDGLIDLNDLDDCPCEVIELVSLIPNPDFEEMNCCPQDRSELNCATGWIQASEPTTDYLHTCGWMGWPEFPPPLPFPSGNGAMGFRDGRVLSNNNIDPYWKEYAGACLNKDMQADSAYVMNFELGFVNALRSPPINITFFGTTSCDNLPFGIGNSEFGCPTNSKDWVRLGDAQVFGEQGGKWINVTIEITPEENIKAIAIGPDCPDRQSDVSLYYFFDNLILSDINSFDLLLLEKSHPCSDDFALSVRDNPFFTFQWYKEGIALVGETAHELSQMYGEGSYQIRVEDDNDCRLSEAYEFIIPSSSTTSTQFICNNQQFEFGGQFLSESGIYFDTLKTQNNCDSIIELNLEIRDFVTDSLLVSLFEGESYSFAGQTLSEEGLTPFNLTSSQGCDSILYLRLEYFDIYFPNVFSPNLDGINDVFRAYAEEGLIESAEIAIFDRWGAEIFRGPSWDGRFRGDFVNPGVYIYTADLKILNSPARSFSGAVTVLR